MVSVALHVLGAGSLFLLLYYAILVVLPKNLHIEIYFILL